MSLTRKVIKGGVWATFFKIILKAATLLRVFVLARLLGPETFGYMAVVLLCLDILYLFSQLGVNNALIHKGDEIEEYIGTARTITMVRGITIAVILITTAKYLANFFNCPGAIAYIQVSALAPMILGFINPNIVYLEKELDFGKKYFHEALGVAVDILLSIVFAIYLRNVWALVLGLIGGNIARVIYSYVIVPCTFTFRYDQDKAKELFNYGKWIFLNGILVFLLIRAGDLFVAKLVDVVALGYYTMAIRVATLIPTEIVYVFNQVLFPAYSKIKDELVRVRDATLKVARINSIIGFPISLLTCIFAEEITGFVFGNAWRPIIPLIRVLAFTSILLPVSNSFESLYMSQGKNHLLVYIRVLNILLLFPLIYFMTRLNGVEGASAALVLTQICLLPINVAIGIRLAGLHISEYLSSFKEGFFASVVMVSILLALKNTPCPEYYRFIKFIGLIVFGAFAYYLSLLFMLRRNESEMFDFLRPRYLFYLILRKGN